MKTIDDFYGWFTYTSMYKGWARYAQFGDLDTVIAISYEDDNDLRDIIEDLSGGDIEALDAAERLRKNYTWWGHHKNPVKALEIAIYKVKEYYFNKLNKQDVPNGGVNENK